MFTDIVGSTELAAQMGDQGWLDLRGAHDALVRQLIQRFRGREILDDGRGFLAIFDGPARGVRCGVEIAAAVRSLGLEVRVGLHTGEVELETGAVGGIAVHLAERVMSTGLAGRVMVSGTVKDLVIGSGIEFAERGSRVLKGVPGEWQLFEVARLPQAWGKRTRARGIDPGHVICSRGARSKGEWRNGRRAGLRSRCRVERRVGSTPTSPTSSERAKGHP